MPLIESAPEATVLCDMDGVIANFETPNNAIISTLYPHVTPIAERSDFYFHETYAEHEDVVRTLFAETRIPGFFRTFPIIDGAIEGWHRMIEAGYQPRVCSSPLEDHETVIDEKRSWLEEHFVPVFGMWVVDTAIFDRDKSSYPAIAMIDDRPTLRGIEKAVWRHIVFDHSYNRNTETTYRLLGWHDPMLESLLDRAKFEYVTTQ